VNPYWLHAATLTALAFLLYQTSLIGRHIVATQEQVDALTAQVQKVGVEVQNVKAALADVQAQLADAGVPADVVDLSGLVAAVQAVDVLNPDPVVDPVDPVEPPADEVVPTDETPAE
jgi:hypothetical protein